MLIYCNGCEVVDLKDGKKKDGSPWYFVKFSDSSGTLCGFCTSDVYSNLKKGSFYNFGCFVYYSRKIGLRLLIKECEAYVN